MTGEMIKEELTPETYPLQFAIADALGGEVQPFDVYQGPYVSIGPDLRIGHAPYAVAVQGLGITRLWVMSEDGVVATIFNEANEQESDPFLMNGPLEAVCDCARQVLQ